jgi:rRNA maturation endonuclease Nob1
MMHEYFEHGNAPVAREGKDGKPGKASTIPSRVMKELQEAEAAAKAPETLEERKARAQAYIAQKALERKKPD